MIITLKEHKIEFIKTILYNYPFPEIYFSDAANDQNLLGNNPAPPVARTKEINGTWHL